MKVRTTLILILGTLSMAACRANKAIEQPPQGVQVQRIEATSVGDSGGLRFSAFVMPDSQVLLAFRIPGYVSSLMQVRGEDGKPRDVAEGDHVNRGAVLVRIRPAEYRDKFQQATSQSEAAEAAAQKAKLDFERASRLFESQSITKPEFDAARAQYDATQAQLRAARAVSGEAQIALRDTALVVPTSGDVVKKAVEIGSFVGPGVPAFAVANTDRVKIIVGVPDTVVRSLKLGQSVAVTVDAFPNRTFDARISRIASAADSKTRNFDVEVAIANRDHILKVGMIGSLRLVGTENAKPQPSILVPLSAIVQAKDGKYGVFLVSASNGESIARLRTVEVGAVEGSDIQIVSGLSSGEMVITTGATLLKEGQRVEILK